MKKIIISLLFVSISQWACAFSDRGHELVAELAWDRLTPFAREQVARILGPGKQNFVKASVWADKVKGDERFDYLKPMHYVNLEVNKYNQQNDCPDRRCVVAAIQDFSVMVVKGDRREQQLALRMLVHLIADIHQPLHAGDAKDRGGNWINITYRGDEMKLHQAWDDELINPSGLSEDALLTQLMAIPAKDFDLAGPVVWAEESHKLAKQLAYQATDKSVLSENYISRSELMLQRQLALAGWRLAMWLNQVW